VSVDRARSLFEKRTTARNFQVNLEKVARIEEGGIVLFASGEKFVQFVGSKDEGCLICDIPLAEFSEAGGPVDVESNEQVSYQAEFDLADAENAAQLTERIFIDVFGLSPNYNVTAEVNQ
jgi:hypothetical protein